jgi:DNA-binding NtrC family response regulator
VASDHSVAQLHGQNFRHSGTSPGQLPLAGKSVLVIEDEALIAWSLESCLLDAGAAFVKIVNSIACAAKVLDDTRFDAAILDLHLPDGNAIPLMRILSERGIRFVISTGDDFDAGQPALSTAVTVLEKPFAESDLIEALVKCVVVAPNDKGSPWLPSERVTALSKQLPPLSR